MFLPLAPITTPTTPGKRSPAARLHVGVVVAAMALTGCGCLSRKAMNEANEALEADNLTHAAQRMRLAAARVDARILALRPRQLYLSSCDLSPEPARPPGVEPSCIRWRSADGELLRFEDRDGTTRLALVVGTTHAWYARLARAGDTYYVLRPELARVSTGARTACECDGGPTIIAEPGVWAFVLDDAELPEVRRVTVPITEEYIEWRCEATAV